MKPETAFIHSVHENIGDVHWEKMHNEYRSDTADCWYSGSPYDLWVEYKFVKLPKRALTMIELHKLFTDGQLRWLAGRHHEGRRVFACVGTKIDGRYRGIVLEHPAWLGHLTASALANAARTTAEIARWVRASALNLRLPFRPVFDVRELTSRN